jgi:hypothetical protein
MSARSRLTNRSKVLNPGRSMAAEHLDCPVYKIGGITHGFGRIGTMPLSRRSAISS